MSIKAYPCIERGGIVWAYMGPPDKQPAPPERRVVHAAREPRASSPSGCRSATTCRRWKAASTPATSPTCTATRSTSTRCTRAPRPTSTSRPTATSIFDIEKTDFGLTLFGRRNGEPDSYYWRITQWIFPWFTLIPPFGAHALGGHVWVPIDDENCWAWSINFLPDQPLPRGGAPRHGGGQGHPRASTSRAASGRWPTRTTTT